MSLESHHTFMVLTKRPARMRKWVSRMRKWVSQYYRSHFMIPNVWLGVSAENQRTAAERIPILLDTPAAVRFVSCEPLLGPVSLEEYWIEEGNSCWGTWLDGLDWVITGTETGGSRRPAEYEWFVSLLNQCVNKDVPFFLKQMEINGELVKMPMLTGRVWDELPPIRQGG